MLIDWFTVIAQIVNFLVLVLLLRIFLYKRIVAAMDKRRQEIAARLDDAEAKKEQAATEAEAYQQKNREWDEQRKELIEKAREEAEERRQELIREAQAGVKELEAGWRRMFQEEAEQFMVELRRRTSEQVCALSGKAMKELANATLEGQLIRTFLDKISNIDADQRQTLTAETQDAEHAAILATAFEVPAEQQAELANALGRFFGDAREIRFEQAPELICGIELRAGGHALGWNIAAYLEGIEDDFADVLAKGRAIDAGEDDAGSEGDAAHDAP